VLGSLPCQDLPDVCPHEKKWHVELSTGARYYTAHPVLKGKEWAIPECYVNRFTKPAKESDFISKRAAWYPAELNRWLALRFVLDTAHRSQRKQAINSMTRTGKWGNSLVRAIALVTDKVNKDSSSVVSGITRLQPLKGMASELTVREVENREAIGGMRKPLFRAETTAHATGQQTDRRSSG
jgi:hypothetical protein